MKNLAKAKTFNNAKKTVRLFGQKLWQTATQTAQSSVVPSQDDRPLYFARLSMARAIRQWQPAFSYGPTRRAELIQLLEQTSRGMDTAQFSNQNNTKNILVSGFDPFGIEGIRYGNPSGAVAMSLDGQSLPGGPVNGQVQATIFPVRFIDFDAGMVETFFRPFLTGPNPADMILMLGMQADDYEVEEYAARVRSTQIPDIMSQLGGPSSISRVVPPGVGPGPEFVQSTLPSAVRGALGRSTPSSGESTVKEIPAGKAEAVEQLGGPTAGSTAVAGSGGEFLCNEIFYRTALLGQGTSVHIGFLHVPSLTYCLGLPGAGTATTELAGIIMRVKNLLKAALPSL
jgi:pyrrolidone-carboxylate peptidase